MALTDWLLLLLLQLMMMMMMTLVRILLPQQSMQSSLFTLGIDQIMTATCRISNAELTQIHTLHGDASTVILVGVYNSLCRTHWTHRWIYSSLLILVSVLYSCREACTRDCQAGHIFLSPYYVSVVRILIILDACCSFWLLLWACVCSWSHYFLRRCFWTFCMAFYHPSFQGSPYHRLGQTKEFQVINRTVQ